MIKALTLRDANGRIKMFAENQNFQYYENLMWKVGLDVNGKMVSYHTATEDGSVCISLSGDERSRVTICVYAGDFFTLEEAGAPRDNPLIPW